MGPTASSAVSTTCERARDGAERRESAHSEVACVHLRAQCLLERLGVPLFAFFQKFGVGLALPRPLGLLRARALRRDATARET